MIEKRALLVLNLLEVIKIFILVYLLHRVNNEIRNSLPVTKFFARRPWITSRDYSIWSLRAYPPFDIRLGDNRTGVSRLVSRNTAFLKKFYIAKWKNATSIILCRTTLLALVSDIFIFLLFTEKPRWSSSITLSSCNIFPLRRANEIKQTWISDFWLGAR